MEALIIDAGNSRISCAAWEGSGQLPVASPHGGGGLEPPVPLRELGELCAPAGAAGAEAFLADFRSLVQECHPPRVVLISVVPRVEEVLAGQTGVTVVNHHCDLPFASDVADISRVGPDRLCNVAAAVAAGLTRALVVDAGTATTFDLLVDGVFAGGMIAPGMAFAARRIGEMAARLRPVPFGPATWDVGRDTESALAAGSWHAGVGGVHAVISGLCARHGGMPVILTGGLGTFIDFPGGYHDPHWTLRGGAFLSDRCG
jgi:pantothenate kinase type III